jgi:uncharacterized membrane protein HdeD (DUF308 family)
MLSDRMPIEHRSHLASEVRRTYWLSLVVLIIVGLVGLAIMANAPAGNITFVGLAVALVGAPLAMSIARWLLLRRLARRLATVSVDGEAPSPLVVRREVLPHAPRGTFRFARRAAVLTVRGVAFLIVGMLLLYAFSFVAVVLVSAIQVALKR